MSKKALPVIIVRIRLGSIYAGYLYYLWVLKTVVHIGMHHGFGLSGERDKTMYRK